MAHSSFERVLNEVHTLSYFYHWGFDECMNLTDTMREVFCFKIREQIKMENKSSNSSGSNSGNSPKSYSEGNRKR